MRLLHQQVTGKGFQGALCTPDTIAGPCSMEDVQAWGRNYLVAWGWQQQWSCLFFISSGMLPIP